MPSSRPAKPSYFGKYRATVIDNIDPELRGRLRVKVPDVLGAKTSGWAEACVSAPNGIAPALPAIGAMVWVEFEKGEVSHPIWVGTFWARPGDAPALPAELRLATLHGATVVLGAAGLTLRNGLGASVEMNGPSVSVNNGALVVV